MTPKTGFFIVFCIALACASCYLPPVPLFTDRLLLPKWYLCALAISLVVVGYSLMRLSHRKVAIGRLFPIVKNMYLMVTMAECLYVLGDMFVYGLPSMGASGTFDNPAGLALSVCVAIPCAVHSLFREKGMWHKILCAIALVGMFGVLCLTKSRTGLMCFSFYFIIYMCKGIGALFPSLCIRRVAFSLCAVIILAGLAVLIVKTKTASTSGRAFILEHSWELVKERPFVGHGWNGFEREYMLCQASFFREHPNSDRAMLADEVQHPLNEFVYLWVNHGIMAPIALLFVMVIPFLAYGCQRDKPHLLMLLPLLGVFLFSCFSYPFRYPVAWLVVGLSFMGPFRRIRRQRWISCVMLFIGGVSIVAVVVDATFEYRWNRVFHHSFRELSSKVLNEYETLHGYMRHNRYFLYNYAMTAFLAHDFDRAYSLIEESGRQWNGYNRELLFGDICRRSHRHEEAISHYTLAKRMCPARFAPLEGLYKTYEAMGDRLGRKRVAEEIAGKKVKVDSSSVKRIKKDCR